MSREVLCEAVGSFFFLFFFKFFLTKICPNNEPLEEGAKIRCVGARGIERAIEPGLR